jgi:hypothetical protein
MLNELEMLALVDRQFVGFVSPTAPRILAGGHPCQGLYWAPKGQRPKVAVIAAHYNVDFSEHYIAPYLATRGYGFLGWNTRFRGAEDQFILEHALIDIAVGVKWLREQAGAEVVIILGNSGGGSLMGAYQAEATAATLYKGLEGPGSDALAALPKADMYISLNAHLGRPDVLTSWMDPSVVDEWDPVATDPSLNPFNPDNGPAYSQEFITRYRAAQRARNQRITDWAKLELKRLNAEGIDDRIFPMFRTWADLRFMDPSIDPSNRKPRWCYRGDPAVANRGYGGIGRANTLKSWLSMWSLETSQCRDVQLAKIVDPALVVLGMEDTGVFPSDARAIFGVLGSADKTLEFVPGGHYFEESVANRHAVADLMSSWIAARV